MGCAVVLVAASGCLEPGELDNPQEFLARIGGDGAVLGDGAVAPGRGDGGAAVVDPCDAIVKNLLATCTGTVCHGMGSTNSLNLEGSDLPNRLIGMKASATCDGRDYIDTASPKDSLLLQKLTAKPPCGSPMPLGGNTPTEMQRMCVLEWITDAVGGGAPGGKDGGTMGQSGSGADMGCMAKDSDGDGTNDCDDECINDKDKTKPGVCGCGKADDDSDDDGALDCEDDCPMDPEVMMGMCGVPGLLVGQLDGNPNEDDANPGDLGVDPLGPSKTEDTDWPEQTTFVFTGKIHITSSGVASFYENIDDSVRLEVDGMMLLSDDTWDNPTSGTIMRPEGWYDFELRVGNGGTASGPSAGMGLGFGYSPADTDGSTNGGDYMHPKNSNAMTADLFMTTAP